MLLFNLMGKSTPLRSILVINKYAFYLAKTLGNLNPYIHFYCIGLFFWLVHFAFVRCFVRVSLSHSVEIVQNIHITNNFSFALPLNFFLFISFEVSSERNRTLLLMAFKHYFFSSSTYKCMYFKGLISQYVRNEIGYLNRFRHKYIFDGKKTIVEHEPASGCVVWLSHSQAKNYEIDSDN